MAKNDYVTSLTDGQVERLPKYGRSYISHLLAELNRAKEKINRLEGEFRLAVNPQGMISNVGIESRADIIEDIFLPENSRIKFYCGTDSFDYINIRHLRDQEKEKGILYLSHSTSALKILPRASNSIILDREPL